MDLAEYNQKAETLLSDTNTYIRITNPPTISQIQCRFNKEVKAVARDVPDLNCRNLILSQLGAKLPSFAYFYGLPKVHKPGVPLRPIVATCGTPQSLLSKWLASVLSPLLGNISDSHLLHSSDFIDRLRKLGPVRGKMLSLDVTALFTNVPLDFVLDNLKTLHSENVFQLPIPIDILCRLVRLCVDATYFTFNGTCYQQKFGVSMGSPLSPILANLCMEILERKFVKVLPCSIAPKLWVRYVDDIFIIFQHDDSVFCELFNLLNSLIPSIKFTVEHEQNGTLPFLDTLVVHNPLTHDFSFKVYRKNTNCENYVHYFSSHSPGTKRNIVVNMFNRALRICDPLFLDDEIAHIKSSFSRLGYPIHFIDSCLSISRGRFFNPKPVNVDVKHTDYLTLPFSPRLAEVTRDLRLASGGGVPLNVNFAFRYSNNIRSRVVHNRSSNSAKFGEGGGVYCIPCLDCEKCYIGETGRKLDIRIDEHRRACRHGNSYSAVAEHTLSLNHRISFKNSKIIHKCHNKSTRKVIEGALISLNSTFENNKAYTSEDFFTNIAICRAANIDNFSSISATLSAASSPLLPQVPELALVGTPGIGAYAVDDLDRPPPAIHGVPGPPRRSARIAERRSIRNDC